MTSSRKIALPFFAVCAFSLFGCATPKKEAELDANGKPIEYVWITPTGSHIAVKVPKDQAQTSSNPNGQDQDALRRIQERSAMTPREGGG